ncbi:ANK repeat containing protein [Candidatus Phycorickettsia trachydisci]|uniref:ANK repeat containing protein n=1 Tax=Candidatus Phycorickettsia trachydisci TaxID=2115978 RepID=A0A2P1P6Z6_9RICK|nr:ankyrin repeat domain-containing protein [Candidatus Phycorickettsia trachydisci]AVP87042.1 ANK repeat containing protein [Candidatus Phycorickettsia trachydisci]
MDIITQLFQYAKDKNLEALKNNKEKYTALVEEKIKALKEQGCDINPQDEDTNLTLLHFIVFGVLDNHLLDYFTVSDIKQSAESLLPSAAGGNNLDAVRWLLDNGINVNEQDSYGETALHCAVLKGNLNLINFLLDKNADVNIRNADGETPLQEIFMTGGRINDDTIIGIIKTMIDKGSFVNPVVKSDNKYYFSTLNQAVGCPFQNEDTRFKAVLLIIGNLKIGWINFKKHIPTLNFLTEEDNIDQLFAQNEDISLKIAAARNLHNALNEFNQDNENPKAREAQEYVFNKLSVLLRHSIAENDMKIDAESELGDVLKALTIDTEIGKRKVEMGEETDSIKKPSVALSTDNQEPNTVLPLVTNHDMDLLGDTTHADTHNS